MSETSFPEEPLASSEAATEGEKWRRSFSHIILHITKTKIFLNCGVEKLSWKNEKEELVVHTYFQPSILLCAVNHGDLSLVYSTNSRQEWQKDHDMPNYRDFDRAVC